MAKDAGGHGSNARGGSTAAERPGRVRGMPIAGQDYHTKTSSELHGIAADAHAAQQNFQGSGMTVPGSNVLTENKYADQVNDASSVLGWRARGGVNLSPDGLAAATLAGDHPKSAPVPTHPAMDKVASLQRTLSRTGDETLQKNLRSEINYNRDLALRARNGQVGSGMKFRG